MSYALVRPYEALNNVKNDPEECIAPDLAT